MDEGLVGGAKSSRCNLSSNLVLYRQYSDTQLVFVEIGSEVY